MCICELKARDLHYLNMYDSQ